MVRIFSVRMEKVLLCCIVVMISVGITSKPATSGIFGAEKPSKSDIKNSYEMSLPGYLTLVDFEVDIIENLGNKVDPRWGSRFRASVKTRVESFVIDREEADALFVSLKTSKGEQVDVYGKAYSTLYQGGWTHTYEMEGKPIENMGIPLDSYSGKRVILTGSKEAESYIAQASVEAVTPESTSNPTANEVADNHQISLDNHLLGTWAEICGGWKGNITYHEKGRIAMEADGKIINGTWRATNDSIIVHYENEKEYTWKILKMKQDEFVIRSGKYVCEAKRVK
jgi:hypothetical protein